ncbi:MAG: serine/threonine protein kinase [Acidimicrobiia bacterium]|nr:serine/threonine protein kinase [Acidimicrobiia bacterium]
MTYTVQRRLGRGAMGVVDLAVDADGRAVAIKRLVLSGSADQTARARARIRREAEALERLRHPHIVPLLEVLDDGDDIVLVMPYLTGGSLADALAGGTPLTDGEVRAMTAPLLDALAHAHRRGIVHRDLKPANVLFDGHGRPHLADFGMALLRDATDGLTLAGALVGTPEFMAPEQARGEVATPAVDLFGLGATLLAARTGSGPWGPPGVEPLVAVRRAADGEVAKLPRDLAPDVRSLLAKLLQRRPDRRPTAVEAAALFPMAQPTHTLLADRADAGAPMRSRRLRPLAGIIGAVALIAVGLVGMAWTRSGAPSSAEAAEGSPTEVLDDATKRSATTSTTEAPCTDLPYQPCGEPPAPNTDGRRCLGDTADYDGDPATGCEAEPDDLDGTPLVDQLEANLVPADDVDRYPTVVEDRWQLLCDGTLHVSLTAPGGVSMRLDVLDRGGEVLGTTVSSNGRRSTVSLREPSCAQDDSTTLTVQVRWEGDERSAEPYVLERSGSW